MSESGLENSTEQLKLNAEEDGFVVNPWEVTSSTDKGVDYDKLISESFSVLVKKIIDRTDKLKPF